MLTRQIPLQKCHGNSPLQSSHLISEIQIINFQTTYQPIHSSFSRTNSQFQRNVNLSFPIHSREQFPSQPIPVQPSPVKQQELKNLENDIPLPCFKSNYSCEIQDKPIIDYCPSYETDQTNTENGISTLQKQNDPTATQTL